MKHLILALAITRLTNLVVEDGITEPIRTKTYENASGAEKYSLAERIDFAINCKACTSVWAAAGVLLAWRFPLTRPLVTTLAGSQAALTLLVGIERLER